MPRFAVDAEIDPTCLTITQLPEVVELRVDDNGDEWLIVRDTSGYIVREVLVIEADDIEEVAQIAQNRLGGTTNLQEGEAI
jgi:hypothetical protein